MIIILNKGVSIEDVLVARLKDYFSNVRFSELYPVIESVHIGLEHPFAELLDTNGRRDMRTLFPSITIVSGSDEKTPQLAQIHSFLPCNLEKEDIADISTGGYQVAPGAIAWLTEYFKTNTVLRGVTGTGQRRDHVSIEIWSENIQMKNELYTMVQLFLNGPSRIEMEKAFGLELFDDTIRGQRSGNYNFDFGQTLYGGQIGFDVDYLLEQNIFDSDIIELNQTVWAEVLHGE